jgi:hypothetical protein
MRRRLGGIANSVSKWLPANFARSSFEIRQHRGLIFSPGSCPERSQEYTVRLDT